MRKATCTLVHESVAYALRLLSAVMGYALLAGACVFPKLRPSVAQRSSLAHQIRTFRQHHPGPFIWCHAASAGEIEELIPLLDALREKNKDLVIMITAFSQSGLAALAREETRRRKMAKPLPWHFAALSPLDTPGHTRRAVEVASPALVLVVHRELWPNLWYAWTKHLVPICLMGCDWSRASFSYLWLSSWFLAKVSAVATVDEASTAQIAPWVSPGTLVKTCGSLRAERIRLRLQWERVLCTPTGTRREHSRELFVLASLHEADFEHLKPWLLSWHPTSPKVTFVFCPHNPNEKWVSRLDFWLKAQRWNVAEFPKNLSLLLSPSSPQEDAPQYQVVREVGHLISLYAVATTVYVGGSVKGKIHSVLEPALAECILFCGPQYQASVHARELVAWGAMRVIPSYSRSASCPRKAHTDGKRKVQAYSQQLLQKKPLDCIEKLLEPILKKRCWPHLPVG